MLSKVKYHWNFLYFTISNKISFSFFVFEDNVLRYFLYEEFLTSLLFSIIHKSVNEMKKMEQRKQQFFFLRRRRENFVFLNGITLVEIQWIRELHLMRSAYLCVCYLPNSKTNTLKKFKFGIVDFFPIEILFEIFMNLRV